MKTILTFSNDKNFNPELLNKSGLVLNTTNPDMFNRLVEENRFSNIFFFGNGSNPPCEKAMGHTDSFSIFPSDAFGATEIFSNEQQLSKLFNKCENQKKINEGYNESSIQAYLDSLCPEKLNRDLLEKYIKPSLFMFLELKISDSESTLLLRGGNDGERLFISIAQFDNVPPQNDLFKKLITETSDEALMNVMSETCERFDCRMKEGEFLEYVLIFSGVKGWQGNAIVTCETAGDDYIAQARECFENAEIELDEEELKAELGNAGEKIRELESSLKQFEEENQELKTKLKQREDLIMKLRETRTT